MFPGVLFCIYRVTKAFSKAGNGKFVVCLLLFKEGFHKVDFEFTSVDIFHNCNLKRG